ncbi:putative vivid protein [Annulohypoxylon bovei var. microspora]|nr:putative vivid protein [Annulohypoxylon bovei var. microspora]
MAVIMNSWEEDALQYHYQDTGGVGPSAVAMGQQDDVHDSVIYPGLYAPSGFDMMSILVRVMSRPSPVIELGPIDASCALIMCDLQQQDCPVVYASDPFVELTGYSQPEIIGRNCRFLQAPGGNVRKRSARKHVDKDLIKKMRRAVESNDEIAVEVTNFKKDGQKFINLLTMIPVYWDSPTPRYSVGFLAEKTW